MPFAAAYKITAWNQENQKMNMAKEKVFAVIMNSCVIPGKIIRSRSENK